MATPEPEAPPPAVDESPELVPAAADVPAAEASSGGELTSMLGQALAQNVDLAAFDQDNDGP